VLLFLRPTLISCALLCLPGAVLAGARYYGATPHESQWETASSALSCRMSHAIPRYGRVHFTAKAGGELEFFIEVIRRPAKTGMAQLASLAPAWRPDATGLFLGEVAIAQSVQPFHFDRPIARRLLAELEKGMLPTLTYRDWADGRDEISVAISAVNIKAALAEFLDCLDTLLDYDFKAVERSQILFAFDSAVLQPEARQRLEQVARYLLADTSVSRVVLEGHTDSVGRLRYNDQLSRRRVEAVRDFLLGKGVPKDKLTLRSLGKRKPQNSNKTAEGRALNRHVLTLLVQ